jgi:hypothetical protein
MIGNGDSILGLIGSLLGYRINLFVTFYITVPGDILEHKSYSFLGEPKENGPNPTAKRSQLRRRSIAEGNQGRLRIRAYPDLVANREPRPQLEKVKGMTDGHHFRVIAGGVETSGGFQPRMDDTILLYHNPGTSVKNPFLSRPVGVNVHCGHRRDSQG